MSFLPLEKQVTSLDMSRKLKELGYSQDTLFYWREHPLTGQHFVSTVSGRDAYAAYTVAELLSLIGLPDDVDAHARILLSMRRVVARLCDSLSYCKSCKDTSKYEESCRP